ncbi:hypothetical protein [Peijinzhouia sedimentorum]
MKVRFSLLLLLIPMFVLITSCDKDDEPADPPTITVVPGTVSARAGQTSEVGLSVNAPAGILSITASGADVSLPSSFNGNTFNGAVDVTIPSTSGNVTFTVTDNQNRTATATLGVTVEANPAPTLTAPGGNTEISLAVASEASLTISASAADGISDVTVAVSAGTPGTLTKNFTAGDLGGSVTYVYTPAVTVLGQAVVHTFTITDSDGQTSNLAITTNVTQQVVRVRDINGGGTGTTTWTKDKIYVLEGFVYVNNGQTLTIEPGTVIKGAPGQAENASALIVAKGGTIDAEGTAAEPIIFTAEADDLSRVDDLPINARALWGGLIVLGDAPINHANSQTLIEGIPSTENRGVYGGSNENDNSGILKYVSLRHGATNIGAGNEINGLTMGGVGRGTQISHIEVWGFDDDGFEWFGGTVNTSYLASLYNQDDSFDWDFGWRGQNQFWVLYQEPNFAASDRGFESDGAHSGNLSATVFSQPQIYNVTMIGQGTGGNNANAMFMTEGTGAFIHNSIVMNFPRGINLTSVGSAGNTSRDRLANGDLVFKNNIFYNIGTNTTLDYVASGDGVTPYAPLVSHLQANANIVGNPELVSIAQGNFNPLPAAGGLAFTHSRSAIPSSSVDGFTYQNVNFIGAFGSTNWMLGNWTAAEAYGILK